MHSTFQATLVSVSWFFIYIYIYEYNFIYLFLAVLGLRGCAGFSLMAVSKATVVAVCGLLIAMASFVAEHKLQGL